MKKDLEADADRQARLKSQADAHICACTLHLDESRLCYFDEFDPSGAVIIRKAINYLLRIRTGEHLTRPAKTIKKGQATLATTGEQS
jgi:hypothetical protein